LSLDTIASLTQLWSVSEMLLSYKIAADFHHVIIFKVPRSAIKPVYSIQVHILIA